MSTRIKIQELEPKGFQAMYAFSNYMSTTQVSTKHQELIKIRASQINQCAFCLDMHTQEALKNGENIQRIFLLNAWRESDLFTEEEKIILAITEEITLIHQHGLSDETYKKAESILDKNYIAQVILCVVIINAWNRIAVSTQWEAPNRTLIKDQLEKSK